MAAQPQPYQSFVMSVPNTPVAQRWLMELDHVDILEGSIDQLADIAERAPTESNKAWLHGVIFHRRVIDSLHPLAGGKNAPEVVTALFR